MTLKVKIFDPRGTQVLQITKSTLTIGSAAHCDVVLDHPSVHPEHTRAWLEGGRVWIQDLGGEFGTALNEIRLPGLKPMLVRELDVLRLGQCEATLGLEPNMVRAPVVKAKAIVSPPPTPVEEPPRVASARDDAELNKRKEELEALGREAADLRLQLQMARLEKNSNQEMASQLQRLQEEVKAAQEQKLKWSESLRQSEVEQQQRRKAQENELRDLKARLERENIESRAQDKHVFEDWKREAVGELAKRARQVSSLNVKKWATRPLSQDMIFEWEGELMQIFRTVLLNEKESVSLLPDLPPVTSVTSVSSLASAKTKTGIRSKTSPNLVNSAVTSIRNLTRSGSKILSESGKTRKTSKNQHSTWGNMPWRTFALRAAGLVGAMLLLWLGTALFKRSGGRIALSSRAPEVKKEVTRVPATRFEPKQSRKYRASYTDNVLYLENYAEAEQNMDFRKRWLEELNHVATTDWKMDQWSMAPVSAKEQVLIQDLSRIKDGLTTDREQEGIGQMRSREAAFQHDLEVIFKNKASVDRFLKFKRGFYMRNQAYLTKEAI